MKRTDLNISNATRIIITRAKTWTVSSRLYAIEIRWDYDGKFAKYVWNNERYSLPSPVANKVVHVDTKIVAKACAKAGLTFGSRYETNPVKDFFIELWRNDLKDNKEEQEKILSREIRVSNKSSVDTGWNLYEEDEVDHIYGEDASDIDETNVTETITVTKITKKEEPIVEPQMLLFEEEEDENASLYEDDGEFAGIF